MLDLAIQLHTSHTTLSCVKTLCNAVERLELKQRGCIVIDCSKTACVVAFIVQSMFASPVHVRNLLKILSGVKHHGMQLRDMTGSCEGVSCSIVRRVDVLSHSQCNSRSLQLFTYALSKSQSHTSGSCMGLGHDCRNSLVGLRRRL